MWLDETVAQHFGLASVSGRIGVEIEAEGAPGVNSDNRPAGWKVEHDSSLRGDGAREYVFSNAAATETAKKRVTALYAAIDKNKGYVENSMRAGVHVHLNVQRRTLRQVFTFLTCYYCFESLINRRFGEERQGNLFCLRMIDADYVNTAIEQALRSESLSGFRTDTIRYCAANLTSLCKYGSLEFRSMQTPQEPDTVNNWISFLDNFEKNSIEFETPQEVLNAFSADGWEVLARRLFGDDAASVIDYPDAQEEAEDSMRAIQLWVMTTEWKE